MHTMCQNHKGQATHVPKISNLKVLNCNVGGGKKKRTTDLGDVRVPVNVANVVIGQASKEIDQMLRRCRTACYTGKTEILTILHSNIFFNKFVYSPLPSLEDFAQTPIS